MYKPQFPFTENQIILNSDRVLLNSKSDSIFLFSNKAISFSSNEGLHINTKETIINSDNIYLGLNADEPIPLGNKLNKILLLLFENLENVGDQLVDTVDSNGNSIPSVQTAGNSLINSSKRLKKLLKNLNSTKNFTL